MSVEVRLLDYESAEDAKILVELLNGYAMDPMGGGEPLNDFTQTHLAKKLSKVPTAFTVACFVDGVPAGLINCFEGFSTFKCKPLINIHDVVVLSDFRGQQISQKMMNKVEAIARVKGACKLTLEVLEGNQVAQNAYVKFGFSGYELDPTMGKALFWEKPLK